jgi:MFS family permease
MLGSIYGGVSFNQVEGMGRRTNQYVFCMIVSPLLYVGIFFLENVYSVSVLIFCIGFFSIGLPNALVMPQFQIVVPNDLRGRVMSVNLMVISCCVFGAALSGFLIDVFDKNAALVMGLWGVLACVVVYPLLLKKACLGFLEVVKKSVGDGNGNQLAHIHK